MCTPKCNTVGPMQTQVCLTPWSFQCSFCQHTSLLACQSPFTICWTASFYSCSGQLPYRALHFSPDRNKLLTGTKRRPTVVQTLVLETDGDTNPGLPAQEIFYYLPSPQSKHSSLYYCLTLLPALGYTCKFIVTYLCPIELFIFLTREHPEWLPQCFLASKHCMDKHIPQSICEMVSNLPTRNHIAQHSWAKHMLETILLNTWTSFSGCYHLIWELNRVPTSEVCITAASAHEKPQPGGLHSIKCKGKGLCLKASQLR